MYDVHMQTCFRYKLQPEITRIQQLVSESQTALSKERDVVSNKERELVKLRQQNLELEREKKDLLNKVGKVTRII